MRLRLGLAMVAEGLSFWELAARGVCERAKQLELGLEVIRSSTPREHAEALRQFSLDPVDVLLVSPAVHLTTQEGLGVLGALKRLEALEAPVVLLGGNFDSLPVACAVSPDDAEIGRVAAAFFANRLGGSGELGYLRGSGSPVIDEEFYGTLARSPSLEVVFVEQTEWTRAGGRRATELALDWHPELGGILACNEDVAVGAVDAVEAAGRSNVVVLGLEGTLEGFLEIYDGRLPATIDCHPLRLGSKAVDLAVLIARGESVPARVVTGIDYVSRENVVTRIVELARPFPAMVHELADRSSREVRLRQQLLAATRPELHLFDDLTDRERQRNMLVERAMAYLSDHLAEPIGIDDLAAHLSLSRSSLHGLFERTIGKTVREVLTELRIARAKEYLEHTSMSVTQIGRSLGYRSPNYFYKVFKRQVGCTPREYVKWMHAEVRRVHRDTSHSVIGHPRLEHVAPKVEYGSAIYERTSPSGTGRGRKECDDVAGAGIRGASRELRDGA